MGTIPELIERVVLAVRSWGTAPDEFTLVESVEAAVVDEQEGLALQWTQKTLDQGTRRFGIIVTAGELAAYSERLGVDRMLADLHLMLVEPHHTDADENTRTWFRSVRDFVV